MKQAACRNLLAFIPSFSVKGRGNIQMISRMIIRNGIRSNLRAKGRSALFFVLILLLTAALILSLGVNLFCSSILAQCDEQYHSIALVEYMGADYPNDVVADSYARAAARDIEALDPASFDGVLRWTPNSSHLGYLPEYKRANSSSPYSSYAVLEIRSLYPYYEKHWEWYPEDEISDEALEAYLIRLFGYDVVLDSGDLEDYKHWMEIEGITGEIVTDYSAPAYYTARVSNVLYGNDIKAERMINIVSGRGFLAETNESYFVNGVVVGKNQGSYNILNSLPVLAITSLVDSDELPYEKIDALAGSPAPERFLRNAEIYSVSSNYINVEYAENLEDIYEFNQGILFLDRGEISSGSELSKCVISYDIAERCSFDVGDVIDLQSLVSSDTDLYDLSLSGSSTKYLVAGITNNSADVIGHIWVIGRQPADNLFGYHIGTLSLDNEAAASTAESIQELMPQNVRVVLYDQGYQDAARPFIQMRSTALNVLIVTCFATAVVLFLFAYLFITRQHQSVTIMVSLGTPKNKIALFLLAGALVIAFAGAAAGTVIGRLVLPSVFRAVNETASAGGQSRLLYSETMLGVSKTASLTMPADMSAVWICGGIMILASAVFCALFLRSAFRNVGFRKGVSKARVPKGKTSLFGRGSLRFALLSIKRGGLRSLVVPLVCMALTVVVIVLGGVYSKARSDFNESLKNTQIDGIAVSSDGKYYSGLVISVMNLQKLVKVEGLESVYISQEFPYYIQSEMPEFGSSGFSQESKFNWIMSQPHVVACNAFNGSSEFYYSEAVVKWLDGWDESFLSDPSWPTIYDQLWSGPVMKDSTWEYHIEAYPAVVSDSFAEDHGYEMGDEFSCIVYENRSSTGSSIPMSFTIVGMYHQTGGRDQIYIPLASVTPLDAIFDADSYELPSNRYDMYFMSSEDREKYYYYRDANYSTCRFTLSSADELDQVREYLWDTGFSSVGRIRSIRIYLTLRDASYLKLTDAMNRYIETGRMVTGMVSFALILVGFIISWLMIHTRKMEFALMRGFGAARGRVFFSFFLEQLILCLVGCIIGCLALLVTGEISSFILLAVGGYIVCYLLGTVFAIALIGKTRLMELLANRE